MSPSERMTAGPSDRLALVSELFEALADDDISYVHWKSNEHLAASLTGDTDFDLLVDRDQRSRFESVLEGLGFVPLLPQRGRVVPGVEGWLGFDADRGTLVHLDVHYDLVLGERLVKNHHLPLERWLLDDPSDLFGVRVPVPARELVLLYVRMMLKTSLRQMVRSRVKGGSPVPDRIRREAAWLAGQVEPDHIKAAAVESALGLDPADVIEFHSRALTDRIDLAWVIAQRRKVTRALRRHQRLPWWRSWLRKVWLRFRNSPIGKRVGLAIPPRRLAGRAPLVAVVGADGAGKTRLVSDLTVWLGRKLVVHHVYFGQPKTGFVFQMLGRPGSLVRNRGGIIARVLGPVARRSDALKWVVLARRRRRLAIRARALGRDGQVVLAERFPLRQFFDMDVAMDGPRLRGCPFASAERTQYEGIGEPDLTVVLRTDLTTLRDRKLDLTLDEHTPKVEAVATLSPGEGMVIVDAGRSYDEVFLEAKRAIWEAFRAPR